MGAGVSSHLLSFFLFSVFLVWFGFKLYEDLYDDTPGSSGVWFCESSSWMFFPVLSLSMRELSPSYIYTPRIPF